MKITYLCITENWKVLLKTTNRQLALNLKESNPNCFQILYRQSIMKPFHILK